MRNLLILGGTVVALFLLGRGRLASHINVVFRGLNFTGGLRRPRFTLRFGVQNPTSQAATVRSIVGQVLTNGRAVADVSGFQPIRIGPNSESIVTVNADPAGVGIAQTIIELLRKKDRERMSFEFSGTVNVDGLNIPVQQSVQL